MTTSTVSCRDCRHYRNPRRLALLLEVEAGRQGALGTTIQSTMESEVQQESADSATRKAKLLEWRRVGVQVVGDEWDDPPQELPYCGRDEEDEHYGICEIRNGAHRCPSFEPAPAPTNTCETCRWATNPGGRAETLRTQIEMWEMADAIRGWGGAPPFQPPMAGEGIPDSIAREFEIAYHNRPVGTLITKPEYLRYCARYSRPEQRRWWLCLARNRDDRCPGWNRELDERPAATSAPADQSYQPFRLMAGEHHVHPAAAGLGIRLAPGGVAISRPAPARPLIVSLEGAPADQWLRLLDEARHPLAVAVQLEAGKLIDACWLPVPASG